MILQPLTLEGAKAVLPLREKYRAAMRTNAPLNEEDQEAWWYHATARGADSRWWEVTRDVDGFAGYCGVEHVDWIARTGEMSVLIDGTDEEWGDVFDQVLNRGFDELNLRELHAEVYHCSPDRARWLNAARVFRVQPITLPMRKYFNGQLWDADYLSWRMPS